MNIGERFNPYGEYIGSFLPNALLRYKGLSLGAKVTWSRLAQYAGKNGKCYPKQETLAEELGISISQVQRYLAELGNKKFIEKEHPKGQDRFKHKSVRYFFLRHECLEELSDVSAPSISAESPPLTSAESALSAFAASSLRESEERESEERESEERERTPQNLPGDYQEENFRKNSEESTAPPTPCVQNTAKNPKASAPQRPPIAPAYKPPSTYGKNSPETRLVGSFCEERKKQVPEIRPPNTPGEKQKWAAEMHSILEKGYTFEEIVGAFKFAFRDTFWRGIIAEPRHLGKNMDSIKMKMSVEKGGMSDRARTAGAEAYREANKDNPWTHKTYKIVHPGQKEAVP